MKNYKPILLKEDKVILDERLIINIPDGDVFNSHGILILRSHLRSHLNCKATVVDVLNRDPVAILRFDNSEASTQNWYYPLPWLTLVERTKDSQNSNLLFLLEDGSID